MMQRRLWRVDLNREGKTGRNGQLLVRGVQESTLHKCEDEKLSCEITIVELSRLGHLFEEMESGPEQ